MIIKAVRVTHTDKVSDGVTITTPGWSIEIDGKLVVDADGDIIFFSAYHFDAQREIARLIQLAWDNFHTDIEEEE